MRQLLECYAACGRGPRRVVTRRGAAVHPSVCAALLTELRATQFSGVRERPKVSAHGYFTLQRPSRQGDKRHLVEGGTKQRRMAAKLVKHARLWELAEAAMREVDPEFWDSMTAVAFTYGFVGSPHIDTENMGCFYGLALGDFGPPAPVPTNDDTHVHDSSNTESQGAGAGGGVTTATEGARMGGTGQDSDRTGDHGRVGSGGEGSRGGGGGGRGGCRGKGGRGDRVGSGCGNSGVGGGGDGDGRDSSGDSEGGPEYLPKVFPPTLHAPAPAAAPGDRGSDGSGGDSRGRVDTSDVAFTPLERTQLDERGKQGGEGFSLDGGRHLSDSQPISDLSWDIGHQLSASQPISDLSLDSSRQLSTSQPTSSGLCGAIAVESGVHQVGHHQTLNPVPY
jgi:hypothetical protein